MTSRDRELELDLTRGAQTSLRNNASAYAFSVFITACFAIVDAVVSGRSVLRFFLFAAGATVGFVIVELVVSRGFRDRVRPERSEVVMLGAAMAPVSVMLALGAGWGSSQLVGGAAGWFAAPLLGTLVFLTASSLEMALARRLEREHPPED